MACDSKYYVGKTVVVEYAIGCGDALPDEADWKLVDAMTTKSLGSNWDTIDTTNSDSKGSLRENMATFLNFTFNGGGMAMSDSQSNVSKLNKHYLNPVATNGQPVAWFRFTYPDLTYTAFMLINNLSLDGGFDEVTTYTLETMATASDFGLIVEDTPSPLPAPTSVVVAPTTASITTAGGTVQLTATALPAEASQDMTWTSSAPLIATVSATGLVTAVADGSATITARSAVDATKSSTSVVTITNQ